MTVNVYVSSDNVNSWFCTAVVWKVCFKVPFGGNEIVRQPANGLQTVFRIQYLCNSDKIFHLLRFSHVLNFRIH